MVGDYGLQIDGAAFHKRNSLGIHVGITEDRLCAQLSHLSIVVGGV